MARTLPAQRELLLHLAAVTAALAAREMPMVITELFQVVVVAVQAGPIPERERIDTAELEPMAKLY